MGLIDRFLSMLTDSISDSANALDDESRLEQEAYRQGFYAGKRGKPKNVWTCKAEKLRGIYKEGYADGQAARRAERF